MQTAAVNKRESAETGLHARVAASRHCCTRMRCRFAQDNGFIDEYYRVLRVTQ